MLPPTPTPTPAVSAIFARAERVFERRVDQLLHHKRAKARVAGTPFNARKAKRDARTVAGREKLDALVRRLADLASVQEAALGEVSSTKIQHALNGAAAAVVGAAALAATLGAPELTTEDNDCMGPDQLVLPHVPFAELREDHHDISDQSVQCAMVGSEQRAEEHDSGKDMLDTSSCSDDGCPVFGCQPSLKDAREPMDQDAGLDNGGAEDRVAQVLHSPQPPCDRHIFPATESVVNFVLECDDDAVCSPLNAAERGQHEIPETHSADTGPGLGGILTKQADSHRNDPPQYVAHTSQHAPVMEQYASHASPQESSEWPPRLYSLHTSGSM